MNIPTDAEMRDLVCDDSQYEYVGLDVFDAWLKRVKRDAWWEGQESCYDTYPWEDNPYA